MRRCRLSQQQKTQELQDRIDQLLGNSAAQKDSAGGGYPQRHRKVVQQHAGKPRSSAAQQGTSAYNAQMQAQAAEAKAREQAAAQAAAQAKAQAEASGNGDTKRSRAFINLMFTDKMFDPSFWDGRYKTYNEYIEDMLRKGYSEGKLNAEELTWLARDYYGVW